jgi:L-ascorbate metabolism protein UlaG (beta-lactamase superfamily)
MRFKRCLRLSGSALAATALLLATGCRSIGDTTEPALSAKAKASPQFDGTKFKNVLPMHPRAMAENVSLMQAQLFGDQVRVPPAPIPVVQIDPSAFGTAPGLRAWWLGHASVLLELDGKRLLLDPMFSELASPFSFVGPKRFHPPPISLEQLPHIDAVLISHDHYDHLDMATVQALGRKGMHFYVPLGVGDDLRWWGVAPAQVHELDWGESVALGDVTLTTGAAQHYSGRWLTDRNETLWGSWVIVGPRHRAFYSGDTGYTPHFKQIGERFGPFDLSIIKIGAYGPGLTWTELHMPADLSVQAHVDVRGKRMLPVHWATFNMAHHAWDEPPEIALKAAQARGVELVTPRVGEKVTAGEAFVSTAWWRDVR